MASLLKKAGQVLNKYRFPALVLLVGLFLMFLPTTGSEETTQQPQEPEEKAELAHRLEEILSGIQGVGDIRVLLTEVQGEQTVYQVDVHGDDRDTVIITDGQRNQWGLVQQIIPAQYLGAVIVCQGGDSATVRLSIVEAVSDATGLSADKITVLKMK